MIRLDKLGYTLGEIVMTTAIIGSLAAIAVPNYLRIKMNVNMEMVKQQLRILGQNMNELYNQNNPHQYPEDILTLDGNPAEELAITASLNAINGMGYDITHRIATGGSDFSDRADPAPGMFGISGDECYVVDSSGVVRRIGCSSGEGIAMMTLDGSWLSAAVFGNVLSDPSLSEAQKINILSGMLMQFGDYARYLSNPINLESFMPADFPSETGLPAIFASMREQDKPALESLIEKVVNHLKENGLNIYLEYQDSHRLNDFSDSSGFKIAFQFNENIDIAHNSFASDDIAYREYVRNIPVSDYSFAGWSNENFTAQWDQAYGYVGSTCYNCRLE